MTTIHWERDPHGVIVLTLEHADGHASILDSGFAACLRKAIDRLENERDTIAGIVITYAKDTSFAGSDLDVFLATDPANAAGFFALVHGISRELRRLETLGRPVVAALSGSALGFGLALALAAHYRIALDINGASIGLPEVKLGLLPGFGALARTVRMLGVTEALEQVLLHGRSFTPSAAVDVGLVDEVVSTPEALMTRARVWITEHPEPAQVWGTPGATPAVPAAVLSSLSARLRTLTAGAPLPAPRAIVAAAVEGLQVDIDTALTVESRYLTELATGQAPKNMIGHFRDLHHVQTFLPRTGPLPQSPIRSVAILGTGSTSADIAHQCASAGVDVTVATTPQDAGQGERAPDRHLARHQSQADALCTAIRFTDDPSAAAGADLVIGAPHDTSGHMSPMLAELACLAAPDMAAASTATELAARLRQSERSARLRLYDVAGRRKLLEVLVRENTGDATLARALDFARAIHATAVVVRAAQVDFIERIMSAYLAEGAVMLAEGVPAPTVEQAGRQAGYAVPPLSLWDELGLSAAREMSRRTTGWSDSGAERLIARITDEFGRHGRRTGHGFYDHLADTEKPRVWTGLAEHCIPGPAAREDLKLAELTERLLFAPALEASRCLMEGTLSGVPQANVMSLHGLGFPLWTGGVLRYAEQYDGGLAAFAARAAELAERHGPRFSPPAELPA